MIARALIATPATDAKLRKEYISKGRNAALQGKPREFSGDPNSMVGGYWFAGYDQEATAAVTVSE